MAPCDVLRDKLFLHALSSLIVPKMQNAATPTTKTTHTPMANERPSEASSFGILTGVGLTGGGIAREIAAPRRAWDA